MYISNRQHIKTQREAQNQEKYIINQQIEAEKKDKDLKYLQIQTLQAQLNPHFIFNILQTAKMSEGNSEASKAMIQNLSKMMRHFLESSIVSNLTKLSNNDIKLSEEVELLNIYISFEKKQGERDFDYTISVDENLNAENISIVPMLIQPFVENAVKHGIIYEKVRRCRLDITFTQIDDETIKCTIIDDGVGRVEAKRLQEQSTRTYKSRGTDILLERVKLLNELDYVIRISVEDNIPFGTIVTIEMNI
jgi:LytS/YehU family sensor histidine kinase